MAKSNLKMYVTGCYFGADMYIFSIVRLLYFAGHWWPGCTELSGSS